MAPCEVVEPFKRAHVTPYDVLGYLVPGVFLIALLGGFEGLVHRALPDGVIARTPVHDAFLYLFSARKDSPWPAEVVSLLIFGVAVYVAGHLVASASEIGRA